MNDHKYLEYELITGLEVNNHVITLRSWNADGMPISAVLLLAITSLPITECQMPPRPDSSDVDIIREGFID